MRIGVFDSGVGGLTVLRALLKQIPNADYIYLGDTARLPYGSKSQATIARYAVSSAHFLVEEQDTEFLVIACNTASALALDAIKAAVSVPVLGVIDTGANAAQANSKSGDVLVIATDATVQSHAYSKACKERGLRAYEKACPLLVPLVEEGWIEHPVTLEVLRIYLSELLEHSREEQMAPDTLVLGCTHYPLLRTQIERTVSSLNVIDSADVTAEQVATAINGKKLSGSGRRQFFATDSVSKFRQLGMRFLGAPIDGVTLVDLGG
ncbi:MAG TPA: glutamate racemase [Pseudacidobacterium sp.]|nr:glutamate racemase [Pseudacidobacterium sp.]